MTKKISIWFLFVTLTISFGIILVCCAPKTTKKSTPVVEKPPVEKPQKEETCKSKEVTPPPPPPPTPKEVYTEKYSQLPTEHKVVKGECLWKIAEYPNIYNDPFMWPLIYKANRDQIKDPDLIYPDQVFKIPRSFEIDELKEARRSAGAPKPYLPPQEANLPPEIIEGLGWSFNK